MPVYSRGRARRSLIDTVTFRILSQVATMFSYVVMVRGMAKEDFGVYNLLYAFIPVVSTATSLGLEQSGTVLATSVSLWGAVVAMCYFFKAFVPASSLVQLMFGVVVCGLAVLLYLRSPAISRSDWQILSSVLHGKEAGIFRRLGLLTAR